MLFTQSTIRILPTPSFCCSSLAVIATELKKQKPLCTDIHIKIYHNPDLEMSEMSRLAGPLWWRYWHGCGFLSMVTRWTHHCEAILDQMQMFTVKRSSEVTTVSRDRLSVFLIHVTLSSPAATLKDSSMTDPTAIRTAADECISFHTVSLSTCRQNHCDQPRLTNTLMYQQINTHGHTCK